MTKKEKNIHICHTTFLKIYVNFIEKKKDLVYNNYIYGDVMVSTLHWIHE